MNYWLVLPRAIVERIYSWALPREVVVALFNALRDHAHSHISGPFGPSVGGAPTHLFRWEMLDPSDPTRRHVVSLPLRAGSQAGEMIPVNAMHHTEPVAG